MLVLYKPYKFKFSDLVYAGSNIYVGWFNDPNIDRYKYGDIDIQVLSITTVPNLYDVYLYNTTTNKYRPIMLKKTEAEIEFYVNTRIIELRHANTI